MKTKLTVLALDPGKCNFAAAVVHVDTRTGLKYKIESTEMVEHTIHDITTDLGKQASQFKREIQKLVKLHEVDVIVAERFMVRGRFSGGSAEHINLMLGTLLGINVEKRYITAAQWKNAFSKVYDLKKFYKEIPLVAHKVDASLIGIYGASLFNDTKHFDCIRDDIDLCRRRISKTA